MEMEQADPCGNFHLGFDASHLQQLSTNRCFRVNGKQPLFTVKLCHFLSLISFADLYVHVPGVPNESCMTYQYY